MSETGEKALLPAGLQDILPPEAAREAAVVERLIACFAGYGYERVKLPLMEFETTLLSGAGAAVAEETFRLMDPVSRRMMALRADMTPQAARIAGSRLRKSPRPLRLCYGGQVLRTRGTQLRPERQVGQAGAELIGSATPGADAEIVLLAADALAGVGVERLSVDLSLPTLVGILADELALDEARRGALTRALQRKDPSAVAAAVGEAAAPFHRLLSATGPVDAALAALQALALPPAAGAEIERLGEVVSLVRAAAPGLVMTVDPVEHRGFEYHTGLSFTLFARKVRGELGRGGRYPIDHPDGSGEAATGFTLYMDSILRALPEAEPGQRLFLPCGTAPEAAQLLRAEGWVALAALEAHGDDDAEARRLGCSHVWQGGRARALRKPGSADQGER